jgi:hypothetical protein
LEFASFFKSYMGAGTLVTASLPIPLTSFKLIPAYEAQKSYLPTYTSMLCFLMLACIFYSRHLFARWMFSSYLRGAKKPGRLVLVVPLLLIAVSVTAMFCYQATLNQSIEEARSSIQPSAASSYKDDATSVLKTTDLTKIPESFELTVLYLLMFIASEGAFILMALKEYLQDLLGVQDVDLIREQSGVERK